jgi:uncharacterized protein YraI
MSEENLQGKQPEGNNTGKTIGVILLVLVGIIVVLLVGVFLARALAPEAEATSPPTAISSTDVPPTIPAEAPPTVPPPTVIPPTAAPEAPYVMADAAVNVRSGPSTDFPIYGIAQPGQSAEVIGKSADGGWWAIKISTDYSPDGQAWVSADYTTAHNTENVPVLEAPPLPPDVNPSPPEAGSVIVTTTEPVNVRSGPGNEFPSYGKIPIGVPLQVVGVNNDGRWLAVSIPTSIAPNGIGWVNAAYVESVDLSGVPQMAP